MPRCKLGCVCVGVGKSLRRRARPERVSPPSGRRKAEILVPAKKPGLGARPPTHPPTHAAQPSRRSAAARGLPRWKRRLALRLACFALLPRRRGWASQVRRGCRFLPLLLRCQLRSPSRLPGFSAGPPPGASLGRGFAAAPASAERLTCRATARGFGLPSASLAHRASRPGLRREREPAPDRQQRRPFPSEEGREREREIRRLVLSALLSFLARDPSKLRLSSVHLWRFGVQTTGCSLSWLQITRMSRA